MNALLLVDIQHDFMPYGALPVAGGDEIVPVVNKLMPRYTHIVATQDWHPPHHKSFASAHPGRNPFETVDLNGVPQTLWPDHCIAATDGAALHPQLDRAPITAIFRKGTDSEIDSYSAFYDNRRLKSTGLTGYLKALGVDEIHIAGLAADYCVYYSIKDALESGFRVRLYLSATRPISAEGFERQLAELHADSRFGVL